MSSYENMSVLSFYPLASSRSKCKECRIFLRFGQPVSVSGLELRVGHWHMCVKRRRRRRCRLAETFSIIGNACVRDFPSHFDPETENTFLCSLDAFPSYCLPGGLA